MINTRNSKRTKQKILGHWAQRLYKNEIRRKSHPNCKNKLKNVYNETNQRKLQHTEIGEQLKKDVDETVGSKHFNMVNTKTKTLSYIMGPKTARNSDSTLVSPESTITRQSVCSILSYEKVNNYGYGDSQTKEKHDTIFFENMCVTDYKLNLWENMKYRFKSLRSAKSASNAYILNTQIRSNKARSDFDIHKKLQSYNELKHRKPFSRDYLVVHLHCQQNDRKQGLSNKSLQKQDTNLKTPDKEFQCTQQCSKSNETPRKKITKYLVVDFPGIEEQTNKSSLTTTTIKKFLQLAKPLASKICRVANNTCDCSRNCIIGDSINFIKSKYDRAFARAEDKYTEPCNNFKHNSQMCLTGEKVKDKYTQNNNLKHQNKICFTHENVKDKHTEPCNDLKHKNQKCFAGKEVEEKYIELSNNLKRKNHQHFVDEKFEEKYPEPCNKILKLKNQKYFAGEKVQEKYTDPCNNLKHEHQKCFSDQKVQKKDNLHHKWFAREKHQDKHTEPCMQYAYACNKVKENKREPCQNSKHTNQVRFIDREKGCSNKSTKCHNISATSNQEISQINFQGTKQCKISHNDCVCRVAKKIKSNEICENLVQKQGNKVQKNLKNITANSYACKDARRNPRCKNNNKNQGQHLERVKDRNVHRKKCNIKTITDACLKSNNDFKCNTDEIKSHGIAKTDNKIKQKQVIKKNNKNTNSKEYFKFHDDCTCSKANKLNSSKIAKTCRNKKAIIINKNKNKKTNHKECIKFHDNCTCSKADKYNSNKTSKTCKNIKTINNNKKKNKKSNSHECIHEQCTCKTDKFNSNKISNTCPNIIATSNNVERYVKSTKASLIRRCINCILRHKTSQSHNRTHCNKTYSCHCRKECGVRGSSDYHKTNKGCDQKIWKHVRVRSQSSQMIQVSKFSDCDFHENSISIAVGKSYKCFKSNVDLTNPSKNNFTTWKEDKRLGKCVRIPKSRYTQCSSCLKPAIVSTKAQCGDGNAKHLRYTGKCFFSSERTQTISPKHKSCIGQTSFDKNHKSFNRACTAIPQDHHYNIISCPKNLPIQYDMTRISESCTPWKFNKSNIMKRVRKKSPRPISVKKNKLKKKKKCKQFRPKRSCGDSHCKATWKENFREDMHCLLSRISQRAKKYFCGTPKSRGRKFNRPSNISNGYADCNELYLEALKHKPPLFDTSPSYKNFSNCCCICTQMMCMFAFWCPLFFMFELFRKCFCLFWE